MALLDNTDELMFCYTHVCVHQQQHKQPTPSTPAFVGNFGVGPRLPINPQENNKNHHEH